jgi:hypothetical protein
MEEVKEEESSNKFIDEELMLEVGPFRSKQ